MTGRIIFAARLLTFLVFVPVGVAKLVGLPQMVEVFDGVGLGQWLRPVTGAIELVGGLMLFVRGAEAVAALLLLFTMLGALLAHMLVLETSALPAAGLALICTLIVVAYRSQLRWRLEQTWAAPTETSRRPEK